MHSDKGGYGSAGSGSLRPDLRFAGLRPTYMKPSSNCAASLIIVRSQGGSKVISTLALLTPCTPATFCSTSPGKVPATGHAGLVKVIADAATDRVLGVHIIGAHAAAIIHEGALAVRTGVTARQLADMVHAHPTLAEAVMEAAGDVHGQAIHLPRPN